ncbi:MAG: hypothetical protein P857_299 [Candidatus Xenolissoclinum pacificiensis L6]|uniref:Uncharacterized protein n=1 Tax=Candidatus Xenolissoclinum pacificiensis L6 TaxID=1401685 RepID=W2UZI7_9RICK|nr:MAG: hypothetical protein P857_299 [Candidatus Xenolissoclinum pacificiensis L6]
MEIISNMDVVDYLNVGELYFTDIVPDQMIQGFDGDDSIVLQNVENNVVVIDSEEMERDDFSDQYIILDECGVSFKFLSDVRGMLSDITSKCSESYTVGSINGLINLLYISVENCRCYGGK